MAKRTPVPEWVEAWLKIPFYEEKCRIHPRQYDTVYCGACMQRPLFPTCWEKNPNQHSTHLPVLHVVKCSGRTAVKVEEISELIDVSEIKQFVINHKDIVYLNPDDQQGSFNNNPQIPKCFTCSRKIAKLSDVDYRFCSIACKIRSKETVKERRKTNTKGWRKNSCLSSSFSFSVALSFRKRSRKGIPRRPPLC